MCSPVFQTPIKFLCSSFSSVLLVHSYSFSMLSSIPMFFIPSFQTGPTLRVYLEDMGLV